MRRSSRFRLVSLISLLTILVALGLAGLHLIEPVEYHSKDTFILQKPLPISASLKADQPNIIGLQRNRDQRVDSAARQHQSAPLPYAKPGALESSPISPGTEVVRVGMYVENNYNVDLSGPTYASNGYYWLRWSPRLQQQLETLGLDATRIIEFSNQVATWDSHQRPLADEPRRLPNGDYYQIFEYSSRFFIGNINLRSFPFYTLKLPINLETNDQTNSFTFPNLRLIPDIPSSGIGRFAWINGYITRGWDMDEYRHQYASDFGWNPSGAPNQVSYSQAIFSIDYARSPKASFWSLFQPLLVVLAVVILSPSLSSQFWDSRISIPATAILTLVFMQSSYKADLPDLPYLTFIDKIYIVSYAICLGCFALFVWSANKFENAKTDEEKLLITAAINRIDTRFQAFSLGFLLVSLVISWFVNLT